MPSKVTWAAFFYFGDGMKNEITASAAKSAPPVASSLWLWASGHDANWWASLLVSILTGGYICLQCYYLIKNKGRRGGKHG
ncbi:phage baseplate assembly V domain protein [Burkholderia pseudomallei MSHR3951]|nr:phage baseplate assembly V domain protein [Burkholderia pseudomallei MSHR3964]KGV86279.1 phage baseplate assembly V domain protein [Burkholderia pseudomallei MSHR3951]KGV98236.1 phage baseplate assembly V domain protein [Burkholderia pseudomallei MSHR3960]